MTVHGEGAAAPGPFARPSLVLASAFDSTSPREASSSAERNEEGSSSAGFFLGLQRGRSTSMRASMARQVNFAELPSLADGKADHEDYARRKTLSMEMFEVLSAASAGGAPERPDHGADAGRGTMQSHLANDIPADVGRPTIERATSDSVLSMTWFRELQRAPAPDAKAVPKTVSFANVVDAAHSLAHAGDAAETSAAVDAFAGIIDAAAMSGAQAPRPEESEGLKIAKQYIRSMVNAPAVMRRASSSSFAGDRGGKVRWRGFVRSSVAPGLRRETPDHVAREEAQLLQVYQNRLTLHATGTSHVVMGFDPLLNEHVMIKVYHKRRLNVELMRRLRLELKLAERLKHDALVAVHTVMENDGAASIVMECCGQGDLLREVVMFRPALTEHRVFSGIIGPLLSALRYLHSQGVVHCAITPDNVLMRANGTVCLCDFSCAIDLGDESQAHRRVGALDYLPPEMIQLPTAAEVRAGLDVGDRCTRCTPAVDIWQIGCLTYELLTGRAPFEFPDISMTATAIMYGTIEHYPPHLSRAAVEVISKCLRPDPYSRPSADALARLPVMLHASQKSSRSRTVQGKDPKKTKKGSSKKLLSAPSTRAHKASSAAEKANTKRHHRHRPKAEALTDETASQRKANQPLPR